MVASRMEWATVPSLNSSPFLKGKLWPIHTVQAGWNTATMQTMSHSLRLKQAESHGNNADCDPFPTTQAGRIARQQCRLCPIPYGSSRQNRTATMQTVTHSIRPKQAESHCCYRKECITSIGSYMIHSISVSTMTWRVLNYLYCCIVHFEDSLNITHQQIHQSYIIY